VAARDPWYQDRRLAGLRRFSIAITVFTVLGETVFGFEPSWAQIVVSVVTAYGMAILLELVDAYAARRPVRFLGGWGLRGLGEFLLPTHITSLSVGFLLYAGGALWPLAFASAAAIASKAVFRVPTERGMRHFFNPSNSGITLTLLVFPWVGIAAPYEFTENLRGAALWLLPAGVLISGTFLLSRFAQRVPLAAAWIVGFAAQAVLRSILFASPLSAELTPMTGVAFVLFSMYMVTDPASSPGSAAGQIEFGLGTAAAYGALMALHVAYTLFFALTIVCAARGASLYAGAWTAQRARLQTAPAAISALEATNP